VCALHVRERLSSGSSCRVGLPTSSDKKPKKARENGEVSKSIDIVEGVVLLGGYRS
jgi:hypothetical protein